MLGGGGYTMRNVSRAWAYETGVATGVELGPRKLTGSIACTLFVAHVLTNRNTCERVLRVLRPRLRTRREMFEYGGSQYARVFRADKEHRFRTPSSRWRTSQCSDARYTDPLLPVLVIRPNDVPDIPHLPVDDLMDDLNQDEDTIDPDDRRNQRLLDSRVQGDGELSDSDDEGEGGRKNKHSHKDDHDLVPSRKFVTTTGIMNPGASAASHGAGPSAHPPTSIPTALVTADEMDVDDGPEEEPSADRTEKEGQPQVVPESAAEGRPGPTPVPPAPVQDKPMGDAGQDTVPVAETAPPVT